jgi:STE24 endopeptidase
MENQEKAKAYQRTRHWLHLIGVLLTLFILGTTLFLNLTHHFQSWAGGIISNRYGIVAFYFLFFSLYSLIISFPLDVYSGFYLEHRYSLSNQTFFGWLWEWTKRALLSFGITVLLVVLLYALIWHFETSWWFWVWLAYAAFSLILGKLFPVLIVPLFYKYSPISDTVLRSKIESLAGRYGVKIENVYSLNLSKTTKKANAAFTGFGKTKRVILGDTLLDSFTHGEIEMVLAHELGHFKRYDIWKQFGFGVAISFISFWLTFYWSRLLSGRFGFEGPGDIAAFPLLCLILFVFSLIIDPLSNAFSRYAERHADQFALRALGDKTLFITAMEKLSTMNLADPSPHPMIEFLFYDHPAISKRIKMAEQFRETQ